MNGTVHCLLPPEHYSGEEENFVFFLFFLQVPLTNRQRPHAGGPPTETMADNPPRGRSRGRPAAPRQTLLDPLRGSTSKPRHGSINRGLKRRTGDEKKKRDPERNRERETRREERESQRKKQQEESGKFETRKKLTKQKYKKQTERISPDLPWKSP